MKRGGTNLDDVITLSIASTLQDVTLEFPNETNLLIDEHEFESLSTVRMSNKSSREETEARKLTF